MKPLYLLLIFFALFITGLADALELGFGALLPGIGFVIGIPLAVCVNITMGAGLIIVLAMNGMFHPKFGPAGIVAGAIPVVDSLPIWLGLVIAGIIYKVGQENEGLLGTAARVATSAKDLSFANPIAAFKSARTISQAVTNNSLQPTASAEPKARAPQDLKSPAMSRDVLPRSLTNSQKIPKAANDNKPYVQKTA